MPLNQPLALALHLSDLVTSSLHLSPQKAAPGTDWSGHLPHSTSASCLKSTLCHCSGVVYTNYNHSWQQEVTKKREKRTGSIDIRCSDQYREGTQGGRLDRNQDLYMKCNHHIIAATATFSTSTPTTVVRNLRQHPSMSGPQYSYLRTNLCLTPLFRTSLLALQPSRSFASI